MAEQKTEVEFAEASLEAAGSLFTALSTLEVVFMEHLSFIKTI